MRASYGKSEASYSAGTHRRKTGRRKHGRKVTLGSREKLRLAQLVVCAVLFAAALVGKGIFPQQTEVWNAGTLTVLQHDTDFKTAFVGLGKALTDGEPILETLGKLWNVSIGGGTDPVANQESSLQDPGIEREVEWLKTAACQSDQQALAGWFGIEPQTEASAEETTEQADDAENETAGWAEREDASQPELLEARPQPVYTGPALPENCTMEDMNLGLDETTTPVMGIVSSGFGYRVHPIDGETKFHYGTDVAADVGTPVYAFADGVVDFIGESEAYGQYIQLRHDAGVTTFYAHCSKLCAKKGQKVAMGDVIALVGESGNTTGPHLHLEIRLDGEYLNPVNYIDTM